MYPAKKLYSASLRRTLVRQTDIEHSNAGLLNLIQHFHKKQYDTL